MIRADTLRSLWRTLPVGGIDDIIGFGTCLILAPHPDDESLGCGGLIAACCAAGRPPVVVVLTDGGMAHPGSRLYPPSEIAKLRELEATLAVGILGLEPKRLFFLREADSKAPHDGAKFEAIARRLVAWVKEFKCTAVLAPWRFDPHIDHLAAFRLASAVARRWSVQQISYPIWGWTLAPDFLVDEHPIGGWRLDVSQYLGLKRMAIAAHASQFGGLIHDTPSGLRIPTILLRSVDRTCETFLY